MKQRLGVTFAMAQAMAACATVIGLDEVTIVQGDADARFDAPVADADVDVEDTGAEIDALADGDAHEDAASAKKHVFVTSTMSAGNLGGRAGADARCATAAASAKLPGVWIAWLSESGPAVTSAPDRIPHNGPFYRLDGVIIAQDKARLSSGTLLAPIIVTETGAVLASPKEEDARVWTGTHPDGTLFADCNKWSTTNELLFGTIGWLTHTTNGRWTDNGGAAPGVGIVNWGCQTIARLYCFEL